jgi:hypothetical protein
MMRTRYVGPRGVTCRLDDPSAGRDRRQIGNYDLAEAMLFNGGGHAAPNAPRKTQERR